MQTSCYLETLTLNYLLCVKRGRELQIISCVLFQGSGIWQLLCCRKPTHSKLTYFPWKLRYQERSSLCFAIYKCHYAIISSVHFVFTPPKFHIISKCLQAMVIVWPWGIHGWCSVGEMGGKVSEIIIKVVKFRKKKSMIWLSYTSCCSNHKSYFESACGFL